MKKLPKHILVIRLSAMGDVAMTVPVIRAFTSQFPETKVTILTRAFFGPFFRDIPNVKVYNADVENEHKGILGLFKLSRELKSHGIDAIADLHNVLRSKVLKVFIGGIPFKQIDKGRREKKALIKGQAFRQLKTTHQRYVEVFEELGFNIDMSNPSFPKSKKLSQAVKQLTGEKTDNWIGIAPFAQYDSKTYPLRLMVKVIEKLEKQHKILLFGGGDSETARLNEIQDQFDNVLNVAGKFKLGEELDIISNLDVMLSMDSGNAHIAAMLGKKVITIWGVTHPYAGFYPFNQDAGLAILANREIYPRIPTSIYGNKFPPGYKDAIESISPESIVSKVTSVLQKNPAQ